MVFRASKMSPLSCSHFRISSQLRNTREVQFPSLQGKQNKTVPSHISLHLQLPPKTYILAEQLLLRQACCTIMSCMQRALSLQQGCRLTGLLGDVSRKRQAAYVGKSRTSGLS